MSSYGDYNMNEITLHPATEQRRNKFFNNNTRTSVLDFFVYSVPIEMVGTKGRYPINSHKATVRLLNEVPTVLGIVGRNYQVIPMIPLCRSIEDQFLSSMSDAELTGVSIRDKTSYDGSFVSRD